MEYKSLDFEIKAINDEGVFSGYASTFGKVDLVGDIVQKGAFAKSIKSGAANVKMFYQHDNTKIIGKFTTLVEDEKGLFFEGVLYVKDIQLARETLFLMKEKELKSVSIGYKIEDKSFDSAGNRLLKEIDLLEISPVTFPADPEATIDAVKSVDDMTEREFEKSLRDVCDLSQKQAKALMSGGYKAMKRDVEELDENKSSDLGDVLKYLNNNQD